MASPRHLGQTPLRDLSEVVRGGLLLKLCALAVVGDRTRCSGDRREPWDRRVGVGGSPNGRGGAGV